MNMTVENEEIFSLLYLDPPIERGPVSGVEFIVKSNQKLRSDKIQFFSSVMVLVIPGLRQIQEYP